VEVLVGGIKDHEVHGPRREEELMRGIEHQLSAKVVSADKSAWVLSDAAGHVTLSTLHGDVTQRWEDEQRVGTFGR
jgi:hypothetical protein